MPASVLIQLELRLLFTEFQVLASKGHRFTTEAIVGLNELLAEQGKYHSGTQARRLITRIQEVRALMAEEEDGEIERLLDTDYRSLAFDEKLRLLKALNQSADREYGLLKRIAAGPEEAPDGSIQVR